MNKVVKFQTNEEVVEAWMKGECANAGNLTTNGVDLYSYLLKIGYTDGLYGKVVVNYTVGGKFFKSMTTSRHVGFAAKYADVVVNP